MNKTQFVFAENEYVFARWVSADCWKMPQVIGNRQVSGKISFTNQRIIFLASGLIGTQKLSGEISMREDLRRQALPDPAVFPVRHRDHPQERRSLPAGHAQPQEIHQLDFPKPSSALTRGFFSAKRLLLGRQKQSGMQSPLRGKLHAAFCFEPFNLLSYLPPATQNPSVPPPAAVPAADSSSAWAYWSAGSGDSPARRSQWCYKTAARAAGSPLLPR